MASKVRKAKSLFLFTFSFADFASMHMYLQFSTTVVIPSKKQVFHIFFKAYIFGIAENKINLLSIT